MKRLVASWVRADGGYSGALRLGTAVVWRCDHVHRRRDVTTFNGEGATECARFLLRLVNSPGRLDELRRLRAEWKETEATVRRAEALEPVAAELRVKVQATEATA